MRITDLLHLLEQKAPLSLAEEWDNVGLLVGDASAVVSSVVTCLDVTPATVDYAVEKGANMIVSHHPVIFQPMKRLLSDSVIYRLAACNIAVISLHTNLDVAVGGLNDFLAGQLKLKAVEVLAGGFCRLGKREEQLSPAAFAETVSQTLHTAVRWREGTRSVQTVAVCSGAGGACLSELSVMPDAVVTGELKHHEWLAFPAETTVIEAGHYATEIGAPRLLKEWLTAAAFPHAVFSFEDTAPYQTVVAYEA